MGNRLEAKRTPVLFQEMAAAVSRAWQKLLGTTPSSESLLVILSQSALETGHWKFCYCYNFGNIKAGASWQGDHCFYFADESVSRAQADAALRLRAPRTDGKLGDNVTLRTLPNDRAVVTLYPDHPWCRFRAFTGIDAGAEDYLGFLNRRYARAWSAVEAGDAEGFVRKLKEQGYFTADLDRYLSSVLSVMRRYRPQLMPPPPPVPAFTKELSAEYDRLSAEARIDATRKADVHAAVGRIREQKDRYERIGAAASVPWYVVGVLHLLECDLDFNKHLHNGDPLSARTSRAPMNRPPGAPPFTFEASAADALDVLGFKGWGDWSSAGTLYRFEAHTGFEYRRNHPGVRSPELWGATSLYTKGGYDGMQFDPELVSDRIGVAALLAVMREMDMITSAGAAKTDAPRYPGRLLRRGERDRAIVRLLQERLRAVGADPGRIDGVFGAGTESAVKLFQSRHEDRNGRPLGVDGMVGALTWEALFGAATVTTVMPGEAADPLLAMAVTVADAQAAEPGEEGAHAASIAMYRAAAGIGPDEPWDAAFVVWAFGRAAGEVGAESPVVPAGSSAVKHLLAARDSGVRLISPEDARDDPSLIQPGHVFVMDFGEGMGHLGIVRSVQGGALETIEGNTTGPGGDGVHRKMRSVGDVTGGFIDYSVRAAAGARRASPPIARAPRALRDVAELAPSARCGGLLLKAVEEGIHEEPTWVTVPFQGYLVRVGAHALRASVGGRLLRLPVSYKEVVAIANKLDWIAPTAALSDAIFRAASVRLAPAPQGNWTTKESSQITQRKLPTLEYALSHDEAIERQIPADRRALLASTEGKDWILSARNLTKPGAATTYGWQRAGKRPIQDLGDDAAPPAHDDAHYDYSQTLRPIHRTATRAIDGAEVDLRDVLATMIDPLVLAPFSEREPAPAQGRSDGDDGAMAAS